MQLEARRDMRLQGTLMASIKLYAVEELGCPDVSGSDGDIQATGQTERLVSKTARFHWRALGR